MHGKVDPLLGRRWNLHLGDACAFAANLPDQCVDLVITSPPYAMGKAYENGSDLRQFIDVHKKLLPSVRRILRVGGSLCWQVGYHVLNGRVTPLDAIVLSEMSDSPDFILRNRIIWTYGHGLHGRRRFSGRHEVILWFTRGVDYKFDLDSVRIPQKYPGKKFYKGLHRGKYSSNPLGKNPSDVWDIPNVKANHIEKEDHPCQFPVALPQRLVRALCPPNGLVFDPFAGTASTGVAALTERRRFIGCEINRSYAKIAEKRLASAERLEAKFRPHDLPILPPDSNTAVARKPVPFDQGGGIDKES